MCAGFAYLLRRHLAGREKAAEEIRVQKELFRTTLSSIGDAVITTDIEGRVTFLNAVAQSLTGWTLEDAVGHPLDAVFRIVNESTRSVVASLAIRALQEGAIVGPANHTILVAKDGSERPIDDSAAPIRDADGSITGAVLVFRDVSERKRAEEALHDADRRKDEFLATLAHELRNPLAPLRTALELARRAGTGGLAGAVAPDVLLEMMERQVEQLVRLVDDLLDVARITSGKLELRLASTDLNTVVSNALETCAPVLTRGGHAMRVALSPQALYVQGDATRLSQVVCNLLNNAVKFSPDGSPIELSATEDGRDVVLRVKDRGVGIPADKIDRIFEMFAQADPAAAGSKAGLGIGLTLARQIIEMHGGTIDASSQGAGMGSEFTLRLPRTSAPCAAEPVRKSPEKRDGQKIKIVIADDNRDSADSMAMLLGAFGHEVHVAYDGSQAVAKAKEIKPDVVLLDIGMPGMDGYECARAIRACDWAAKTLLVALTGWGQEDDKRRSREAGFDRHLTKPVDPTLLESALLLPE
jgi:PAS domain S-box-containing protein